MGQIDDSMVYSTKATLASDIDFDISVKHSIPTQTRKPATDIEEHVDRAGVARANRAVSKELPHGNSEYTEKFKDYVS
jgi:hypothetical protein